MSNKFKTYTQIQTLVIPSRVQVHEQSNQEDNWKLQVCKLQIPSIVSLLVWLETLYASCHSPETCKQYY
jgi:hypothetical protein